MVIAVGEYPTMQKEFNRVDHTPYEREIYPGDDWRDGAACTTKDPELFFPDRSDRAQIKRAQAVCAICSVAPDCLRYALESDTNFGIFGGYTEEERRAIRRRMIREQRYRSAMQQA